MPLYARTIAQVLVELSNGAAIEIFIHNPQQGQGGSKTEFLSGMAPLNRLCPCYGAIETVGVIIISIIIIINEKYEQAPLPRFKISFR